MLSSLETPRPLPPAKARKASAMQKLSSSPPPAYGSPFTFPARRPTRQDILGSPMATTFQMVGWDAVGEHAMPSETPDDMAWINEKSREELKNLLLKADGLIRERENEIGITSAVCKGLYQSNVTLKTKHEALLARIPTSPARSISSPASLYHQPSPLEDSPSITASSSESALEFISSRPSSPPKRHARKVSIAVADVCLLSDQNAELLDKLEKLEKEATSTDQAGRRELKRLEKEIAFLREELEKTQARSDELEEKVQGAVASEAWRRKKEREAKFRAMRNLAQDEQRKVRNFAPEGSRFGGPSEAFSFFPMAESPDPSRRRPFLDDTDDDPHPTSLGSHEHALIEQLLVKVQELEETNAKILRQQSETANQLSAVQRDTAHISRVYDCLSDQNSIELEFSEDREEDENEERGKDTAIPGQAIRFMSLKRTLATETSFEGTCIVRPEFTSSAKSRKTVMGLFDVQQTTIDEQEKESVNLNADDDNIRLSVTSSPWSEGHVHDDNSSWSDVPGAVSPSRLSPLHFFSPPSHGFPELSPIGDRVSLQSELGQSWAEMQQRNDSADDVFHNNHHLRTSSLYDLSEMSVPPSPSPTSRAVGRRPSDELDYQAVKHALDQRKNTRDERASNGSTPRTSALLMPTNSLHLSVEPPTPEKWNAVLATSTLTRDEIAPTTSRSPLPRSPRVKLISDTLRSRANRWVDRRLRRNHEYEDQGLVNDNDQASANPTGPSAVAMAIPKHLLNVVDTMIDGFDNTFLSDNKDAYSNPDVDYDDEDLQSSLITPHGRYKRMEMRRRNVGRGAYDKDFDLNDQVEPIDDARSSEVQLHTGTSPLKKASDYENQGFMLKVWLWIQFGIVVFVFLYAMARRGPTIVLTEESKKAVVKRR